MNYWEPIATPGSHLEPPDPDEYCDECEELMDDCTCAGPLCVGCGAMATKEVRYEDVIEDFCDECEYEGEEVPA